MSNQVMKAALFLSCVVLIVTPAFAAISFRLQTAAAPWSGKANGNLELYPKSLSYADNTTNPGTFRSRTAAPGSLILFGGTPLESGENDVWISEDSGVSWVLISGISRHGKTGYSEAVNYAQLSFNPHLINAAGAVDSEGRLFRFGGSIPGNGYVNTVYWSSDAQVWHTITPERPFPGRRYSGSCVDRNNRLYVAGGYGLNGGETTLADVWFSDDLGVHWNQTSVDSNYRFSGLQPWAGPKNGAGGRGVMVHVAYYDEATSTNIQIITTGSADNLVVYNDVWASADGGQQWIRICANAPFAKRNDGNGEVSSAGVVVITAGQSGEGADQEIMNDVWASLDGGWTWGLCIQDALFADRRYLLTVLDKDGYLIVLGGTNSSSRQASDYRFNDVYRSSISFSDPSAVARECGLKVPACGAGLKCWPGPGTYIDGNNMVQCGTCHQISGSSDQSGSVAALAVFMVIFLLVAIGASYYAYTLRNAASSSGVRTNNILGLGSEDSNSLYKPLSFREGPKE